VRAIVYTRYGSPDELRLAEVEKPVPADDEILVRVHAVSVNRSDWEGLTGKPLYARIGGLLRPRHPILGSDVAGRIEAVGRNHGDFRPGEDVFGEMEGYFGGFAEYVCTRGKTWTRKPTQMPFDVAAAIPQAAVIALQALRGRARPGQRVLINGGGGGGGSFAIQLAKSHGADVTGVDNTGKLDFMRSLGADHVVDYTREDYTRTGRRYDFILDLVAYRSVFACARALEPNGLYYAVGGSVARFLQILLVGPWLRRMTGKSVRVLVVRRNREDLTSVTQLCEAGKLVAHIDRRYPLRDVPDALRYLGEGRAKGKIVITVENGGELG
jgi:NADPH:quinone reductase-like Zn-dependent oxidoreductase